MSEDHNFAWKRLLDSWRDEVLSIWTSNREEWESASLPSVDDLRRTPPNPDGILQLGRIFDDCIDSEVIGFYSETDSWPLWLGSFWASMLPADQVNLFRLVYPDAYEIAIESAPESRVVGASGIEISKKDLEGAIVLSQPDAREFVLTLQPGETCVYLFDSMDLHANFLAFMETRRREVVDWLRDMLK